MDLEQAVWVFDTCEHDNTSQVIVRLDCGEELSSST